MLNFGRLSPSVHGTRGRATLGAIRAMQLAEMTSAADRAGWSVTRLPAIKAAVLERTAVGDGFFACVCLEHRERITTL